MNATIAPTSSNTPKQAMTQAVKTILAMVLVLIPMANAAAPANVSQAIFAGGCFWCVEDAFDSINGVLDTKSGYIGGALKNPTYQQVSAGGSGHVEAVEVTYDPSRISYSKLLSVFWRNIDPLDGEGQFCDRGDQYLSAIFYTNTEQQQIAEHSKAALEQSQLLPLPVATRIRAATTFYPAEDYHQNYHEKNPARYKFYKWNCGRQQRLEALWHGIDHLPFEAR